MRCTEAGRSAAYAGTVQADETLVFLPVAAYPDQLKLYSVPAVTRPAPQQSSRDHWPPGAGIIVSGLVELGVGCVVECGDGQSDGCRIRPG